MEHTPLQLAVNEMSTRQLIAQRLAYGSANRGIDTKRPQSWLEYGFPTALEFEDFLNLYERHGVAHGAVHKLLDACWQTLPEVIQGDPDDESTDQTPWEKKLTKLFKSVKAFKAFKEADRMRMVGHYSGILLQVKDNKTWDQPLTSGVLQKLIPAWEGQLMPSDWDADPASDTYGDPLTWTYTEAAVKENDNAAPGRQVTVHASRVFILGSYRTGVPFLKAGYNDCVTMEKITGGAGESYLKNASRQLAISFDKEAQMDQVAAMYGVPLAELHTAFDDVAKGMNRGQDNVLAMQGATVSTLVSSVPDPSMPFDVALQSFAASVQMPAKVIVGSQTGERASLGDIDAFYARAQGRRHNELSDDLVDFVLHLTKYKLMDAATDDDICVVWDDLSEATALEKLTNAKLMADINTAGLGTGDRYFSVDEIRTTGGLEPAGPELEPLPETPPPAVPGVDPNNPDASLPDDGTKPTVPAVPPAPVAGAK